MGRVFITITIKQPNLGYKTRPKQLLGSLFAHEYTLVSRATITRVHNSRSLCIHVMHLERITKKQSNLALKTWPKEPLVSLTLMDIPWLAWLTQASLQV
jgi:hypothetical protein